MTSRTLLLLGLLLAILPARGENLALAAAADMKFALDELIALYQEGNPATRIRASYGSSGNFHAQITQGAPFDLYFSADIRYPKELAEAGFALDGDIFPYAIGRIVIWVPEKSPINVAALGIRSLLAPSVKKIAIANPRHAPYGAAAVAALRKFGVREPLQDRFVLGENIAQAAHFVQSGAADIGIIALSLAIAPQMKSGRYWEIPPDSYPKMEQAGMILKTTRSPAAAKAFRDFVLTEGGRGVFKRYGFLLPETAID